MPKSHKKSSKGGKMYKMKGCSKTKRRHLGGSKLDNLDLAYPSKNILSVPNPHLSYTGKGGSSSHLAKPHININAANPIHPNTGPVSKPVSFLNSSVQKGGNCGCGLQMGGSHRIGCKCRMCKASQKGGNGLPYGQGMPEMKGLLYPNGLVGSPWTGNGGWPGTSGITGNNDHLGNNTYNNDVSRQMIDVGANPPFTGKGGSRKKHSRRTKKGGDMSNFLYQDLVNLGRQFTSGVGNTYNAFNGYPSAASPMPWKNQLSNTPPLSALKMYS